MVALWVLITTTTGEITMKWEINQIAQPRMRHTLGSGKVEANITTPEPQDGDKCWQYFTVSFGAFGKPNQPIEECLRDWPREAIRLARAELDRFEAQLERETNEAGI